MENLQKHLDNPLYKAAKEDIDRARDKQIRYGASKYPETFNPDSWTDEELYEHGLAEMADKLHYDRGMYERILGLRKIIAEKDEIIENLEFQLGEAVKQIEDLKEENERLNRYLSLYKEIVKTYQEMCSKISDAFKKKDPR